MTEIEDFTDKLADADGESEMQIPSELPVLPLRDIVIYPFMIVPLFVGREKSVKALEEVMKDDKQILLIAQKNASQDDPGPDDIYSIGTLGTVLQLLKLPDDTVKVLVEGGRRVRVTGYSERADFFEARAVDMEEVPGDTAELQAAARTVVSEFENYVKLNKKVPPEVVVSINKIEEPSKLADTISAHLALKVAEKQQLLEIDSVSKSAYGDDLEEGLWDGMVWREHLTLFAPFSGLPQIEDKTWLALLVPFLSLPQSTHYALDGFIWRVKDRDSTWSA